MIPTPGYKHTEYILRVQKFGIQYQSTAKCNKGYVSVLYYKGNCTEFWELYTTLFVCLLPFHSIGAKNKSDKKKDGYNEHHRNSYNNGNL